MCNVGYYYDNGLGVKAEENKAMEWYQKAAACGDANAMYNLGRKFGEPNPYDNIKNQNMDEALKWYRKAAEAGNAEACTTLAAMYIAGDILKQDYLKAKEYAEKGSELGSSGSYGILGDIYNHGYGVEADTEKAIRFYTVAAETGHPYAVRTLIECFEEQKEWAEMIRWIGVLEKFGNPADTMIIERLYTNKITDKEDQKGILKAYIVLAEQNDANSMYALGRIYENGQGVTQDYSKAVEWYKKAISLGNTDAIRRMGHMYEKGYGVPKSKTNAMKYYRMAGLR